MTLTLKSAMLKGGKIFAKKMSEDQLQKSVVDYLKWFCPIPFWAVPNGGYRNHTEAARFVGLGVVAGVADLHFVLPGGRLGVIELKVKPNKPTPKQAEWLRRVEEVGAYTKVCYSFEEVVTTLEEWDVTMTCRVTATRNGGA